MSKEIATQIIAQADKLGWTISIHRTILVISKHIEPDNIDEFVKADSEYHSILSLLPCTSPGSYWGTDGSGVGALSAIRNGLFVMNKSGGSKRVLNALQKLI